MIANIPKLQHLWRNRLSTRDADAAIFERVQQIYEIVERWEGNEAAVATIGRKTSPEENGIPAAPWPNVKDALIKMYESEELRSLAYQVSDVETLLHIQSRAGNFRISSNARADSPYETTNTTPTRSNPESYYASYNYPFEIVRFLLNCKHSSADTKPLRYCANEKFFLKFLWMLANRADVVPILSLDSFHDLSPLFRQIADDVAWGDEEFHWTLALPEFISRWPEVSTQLSALITGEPYSSLTPDGKMELSKLLFVASLADTTTKNVFDMVKTGNQAIILYGPPGTGKTYRAQEVVKHLLEAQDLASSNFSKMFDRVASSAAGSNRAASDSDESANLDHSGCWELIQFHPSYSYHDFIGGIMPKLTGDKLGYAKNEGIFKRFCDAAKAHWPKPFVLIIDEINRADLSSVFGELMYALEYRNKAINILQFGAFEIPDNVFVIGTMNSADKSLVTFDLALRRRFLFFKLLPDMNVLHEWNAKRDKDGKPPINDEDLALLIGKANRLNSALIGNGATELGLPEDYGIGQAYFMKIADFCVIEPGGSTERNEARITEFAREQLWVYHLEPLLEEYLGAEADAKKNDLRVLRDAFVKTA